jgi:hypothetical protein
MRLADLPVISTQACIPCVAEVMGVFSYESRTWTLCDFHYMEWVDEKVGGEIY